MGKFETDTETPAFSALHREGRVDDRVDVFMAQDRVVAGPGDGGLAPPARTDNPATAIRRWTLPTAGLRYAAAGVAECGRMGLRDVSGPRSAAGAVPG